MLNKKCMPHLFWADVVHTAIYLINRCPTVGMHSVTPEEVWSNKKPKLAHLNCFGCVCYVHVPQEFKTKLDAHLGRKVCVCWILTWAEKISML